MNFYKIDNNTLEKINIPKNNCDMKNILCILSFDDDIPDVFNIDKNIIDEARKFSYVKYESFENYDCFSIKLLNFKKLSITIESVVIYIEKDFCCFFTLKKDLLLENLENIFSFLGNKISINKIIYHFFNIQSKKTPEVCDKIEKNIMNLEHNIITSNNSDCVREIISLRKDLMVLKRYYEQSLYALDIINENENNFFDYNTLKSFNLLLQRTERRFQNVLNLRESLTQVRESYEAEVDISLNTTMKFFTVVASIFLPLTLIVGWYGMNLQMPEYDISSSYSILIIVCIIFITSSIYYFKKKKWF